MAAFGQRSFRARFASCEPDLARALALRQRVFRGGLATGDEGISDADGFDAACRHVLIEDEESQTLVACFRVLHLACGQQIGRSYSAQFYDLAGLSGYAQPMAELGRFCTHPDWADPGIVRTAWGTLAHLVTARGIGMIFGCTSFAGIDPTPYSAAFGQLRAHHLAPPEWQPKARAHQIIRYARTAALPDAPPRKTMAAMPPLLNSYLAMGAWVSDHAVVDKDLNTLHVFTALEIAKIPPGRRRALLAAADTLHLSSAQH